MSTPVIDLREGLIRRRLGQIGRVVMFSSGKGGVGKSTLSASAATLLSSEGSVGILDIDLHGPSIPLLFGVRRCTFRESRSGLIPARVGGIPVMSFEMFARGKGVAARGASKVEMLREMMAITDFGALDTLVVDLPPGTGDEFLTALEMFGRKGSIMFVTQPTALSWNVTGRAVELAKALGGNVLGVVQNMGRESKGIDGACRKMHVRSLGSVGYFPSISDRPVGSLRGTAFMRSLRDVLKRASLL